MRAATAAAKPGTVAASLKIPVWTCRLVRDRSIALENPHTRSAADVYALLRRYMDGLDRESFVVLLLNTQNAVIGINTVTVGTLDASLVHPREVFKPAILAGAASIILAHNHPSGDPSPSAEDRAVTHQLEMAGKVLGIPILDHVIVGDRRYVSFAEAGLLTPQQ